MEEIISEPQCVVHLMNLVMTNKRTRWRYGQTRHLVLSLSWPWVIWEGKETNFFWACLIHHTLCHFSNYLLSACRATQAIALLCVTVVSGVFAGNRENRECYILFYNAINALGRPWIQLSAETFCIFTLSVMDFPCVIMKCQYITASVSVPFVSFWGRENKTFTFACLLGLFFFLQTALSLQFKYLWDVCPLVYGSKKNKTIWPETCAQNFL